MIRWVEQHRLYGAGNPDNRSEGHRRDPKLRPAGGLTRRDAAGDGGLATRAVEKLRRHRLAGVQGLVFLHSTAFTGDKRSHTGKAIDFLGPADDTQD
ncbi:hypothetical protein [Mesorhizobium sp. Root102]|uniref:hypothetical protein n=1 Tax=Mesorhizobium sp. Root102 TaxID=1736422 RepID=UPI0012E331C5|nr:hypothetical protein [Mesorhizobium sp. Root102]